MQIELWSSRFRASSNTVKMYNFKRVYIEFLAFFEYHVSPFKSVTLSFITTDQH